jgi:hypothetical protein
MEPVYFLGAPIIGWIIGAIAGIIFVVFLSKAIFQQGNRNSKYVTLTFKLERGEFWRHVKYFIILTISGMVFLGFFNMPYTILPFFLWPLFHIWTGSSIIVCFVTMLISVRYLKDGKRYWRPEAGPVLCRVISLTVNALFLLLLWYVLWGGSAEHLISIVVTGVILIAFCLRAVLGFCKKFIDSLNKIMINYNNCFCDSCGAFRQFKEIPSIAGMIEPTGLKEITVYKQTCQNCKKTYTSEVSAPQVCNTDYMANLRSESGFKIGN